MVGKQPKCMTSLCHSSFDLSQFTNHTILNHPFSDYALLKLYPSFHFSFPFYSFGMYDLKVFSVLIFCNISMDILSQYF